MNFVTFEKAYCLYPKATLDRFFNLILKPETPTLYTAIRKYARRGWVPFRLLSETLGVVFRDRDIRWVEDKHSLVVPLPKLPDVNVWPPYYSPLSITTWSVSLLPFVHHRVNLLVLYKDPAIYPLAAAANIVSIKLDRFCLELWDVDEFDGGQRTLAGNDK